MLILVLIIFKHTKYTVRNNCVDMRATHGRGAIEIFLLEKGALAKKRLGDIGLDPVGFSRRKSSRQSNGDPSRVLHLLWHECPALIGTSQLTFCRNQWVIVDQTNLCIKYTCANSSRGRIVHDALCVVSTQLQQDPTVVIYISIIILSNHNPPKLER